MGSGRGEPAEGGSERPTVLLVGAGDRLQPALEAALERHRLMVEAVSVDAAVDAAFAAAPDLLLLLGDAAKDQGQAVLQRLADNPITAMVPVVLLGDETALKRRVEAFRHGVVAVVPRTASADGMARRIAQVARELPERSGVKVDVLGETSVDELIALFSKELRTGVLSVSAGEGASTQMVVRAGRPVAELVSELVSKLRPLLSESEGPVHYEFHEAPPSRVQALLPELEAPEADGEFLKDLRVLLIEQSPARADALVQELRARGVLVAVADGAGEGLERARQHAPEAVVLDGSGRKSWALPALRALRVDPALRWASLLIVDAAELWPKGAARPRVDRLLEGLAPLVKPDRELTERAAKGRAFDTRLELVGPARLIRALTRANVGLNVRVTHPRAIVRVDLAEGLVAGASLHGPGGRLVAEGHAALAGLLHLSSGRVHVAPKAAPASATIMSPVDEALAVAAAEQPPIAPSIPPPRGSDPPPTPSGGVTRPGGRDAEQLLTRLEGLLERLQQVLPENGKEPEEPPTRPMARPVEVAAPPAPPPPPTSRAASALTIPKPSASGRAAAPRQKRVGKPTLAFGSAAATAGAAPDLHRAPAGSSGEPAPPVEDTRRPAHPPPWETSSDLDLPEIEGTAEPGVSHLPDDDAGSTAVSSWTSESVSSPMPAVSLDATIEFLDDRTSDAPPPAVPAISPSPPRATPIEQPVVLPQRRSRSGLPIAAAGTALLFVVLAAGAAALFFFGVPFGSSDPSPELSSWPPDPSEPELAAVTTNGEGTNEVAGSADPPATDSAALSDPGLAAGDPGDEVATEDEAVLADIEGETLEEDDATEDETLEGDDAPEDDQGALDADEGEANEPTATDTTSEDDEPDDTNDEADADGMADPDGEGSASPRDEIAHLVRTANYQRNRGDLAAAERTYLRVLNREPRNARALVGITRVHMARRDGRAAVNFARRLVEIRSRNPNNHVLLGDAYRVAGNQAAATRAYRQALEIAPNHRTARQRLGR